MILDKFFIRIIKINIINEFLFFRRITFIIKIDEINELIGVNVEMGIEFFYE